MDRVDREIAKVEQQILKLKKKQVSITVVICQWKRCGKTSFVVVGGEFFDYMNQMNKLKREGYVYNFARMFK